MTKDDYTNARYWAISTLGYGKGFSVEEAVANHDEWVGRDYAESLKVPIGSVALTVWESGDDVDGFAGTTYWTSGGATVSEFAEDEIRAHRAQPQWWIEEFGAGALELPVEA